MRDLRDYNRVAAVFFLCVGVFFTLYSRRVEIGTWTEPGPGFLPFWSGLSLGAMSIALFLGSHMRKPWQTKASFFPRPDSWKRVLSIFLSLGAYNFLLTTLGFTVTAFLFLFFLVKVIFPQTWKRTLWVSILGSLFARLLFINFLKTQLPKGVIGF